MTWHWIASYPKSGNTWFRAFMANLVSADVVEINELTGATIASSRQFFEDHLPIPTADLTHDQIDAFRPLVYRQMATEERYSKVHDARFTAASGEDLFPADVTAGALYIVRHPFDVCVSYANHNGSTVERAVRGLNDPEHCLAGATDRMPTQVRQRLGTWSQHVRSWLDAPFPVHVIRYEDMHARPVETFSGAAKALGLPHDAESVEAALEACRFERLQQREQEEGFKERPHKAKAFFRSGKVGAWRTDLTTWQAARLAAAHGDVMAELGYEVPGDVAQASSTDADLVEA